jgi:hypothetical protein
MPSNTAKLDDRVPQFDRKCRIFMGTQHLLTGSFLATGVKLII